MIKKEDNCGLCGYVKVRHHEINYFHPLCYLGTLGVILVKNAYNSFGIFEFFIVFYTNTKALLDQNRKMIYSNFIEMLTFY